MKAAKDLFPELTSSVIWNEAPANDWAESYPLGNGRIGAMVQGRAKEEIISLNHDLLWRDFMTQPEYHTFEDMPRLKELCAQKKWYEANQLLKETLPNQNAIYINPFVPACDLYLNMMHGDQEITNYRRALDMEKGVVTVEYDCAGTHYTRAAFCSWEKGLFVLHLTGSHPSALTGMISLSRLPEEECEVTGTGDKDTLTMHGRFAEGKEFAAAARIYYRNGRLAGGKRTYGVEGEEIFPRHFGLGYVFNRDQYLSAERGCSLWFDSCAEITIVVSIATDADEADVDKAVLDKVNAFGSYLNYPAVRDEHIARFSSFANRMQLNLGDEASAALPGSELIKFDPKKDEISPALTEKMFRLARYIVESSGMPEKPGEHPKAPINLQGLWNRDTRPAWESDYHTDLNIEMCYWPTGAGALIEFFEPMLTWAERLLPQAKKLAQDVYGVRGAAYGGCCDWKTLGGTDIVGGTWTGASAWIAQILWIYYEYDPKTELLERLYSLMLEIEKFYQDILIEDEEGFLLPPFGTSPEMAHFVNGEIQWLSSASTCDLLLIRELYETLAKASTLRGDTKAAEEYLAISRRIKAPVVEENGCLREWLEPHEEQQPGHRHRSPMVSLCPGSLIARNADTWDPLVDAMEKLLERRLEAGGDMATSFSYAWDAQFFARLRRGDEAYHLLTRLLYTYSLDNLMLTTNDWSRTKGGIDWFYGTKVLQVDAQLCLISSISELFYQDTQGVICALPALPKALPTGSLTGIRGRNGFRSDLFWKDGRLEKMTVISTLGQICRLYLNADERNVSITLNGQPVAYTVENGVISFPTGAGDVYTVLPA